MSLKRKSFYTSITKVLNIVLNFILQLVLTPLILTGLGSQQFGIYTLINKMQGYLAVADLRPSAILRFKLAILQKSNNTKSKREYVGTSILLSLFTLPIIILLGWFLSLWFQSFFNISNEDANIASSAIIVISVFMGIKSFLGIPDAIIRGNNIEYKAFFIDPIRMLSYGLLVYFLLDYGFGLMGVIAAIIIAATIDFILRLILQIYYLPGYAPIPPKKTKVKEFFGSGSWYMGSSFSSQVLNSFDVVMIGAMYGMEMVTVYALSKAILFRIFESVSAISGGITSSIGELIGTNRVDELVDIRKILFRVNLIVGFMIMAYFIIFNSSFISLWVGKENFIGEEINFIFCLSAFLVLVSLSDEIFINSLQIFKEKTKIMTITVTIALVSSYTLSFFIGLTAIPLGLLIAKIYQWISYQKILNLRYSLNFISEIIRNIKVFSLILIAFIIKYYMFNILLFSWISLIAYSFLYIVCFMVLLFLFILDKDEVLIVKKFIKARVK